MSVPVPRWPGVPQLRMFRASLDHLPPVIVPPGYSLRTYRPGDEVPWLEIMREAIGPSWTFPKWQTEIIGRPQFDPAGLFFAVRGTTVVGSACAWRLDPSEQDVGYIHMVAVRPEERGHKLGYWLTLRVLHRLTEQGMREAILDTDDHRLAAIEVYLRLGFEPLKLHTSHEERWAAVLTSLGRSAPA